MSSINCTEFSRLLEQAVESRLPVDTTELRGHAALCADCRAAWLDALLLDGAVAQWRKTKKMLSPVDLTDIVLFRRTAAPEAAIPEALIPEALISAAGSQLPTPGAGDDQDVPSNAGDLVVAARVPAVAPLARQPGRRFSRRTAAAMVLATAVCVALLSGRLGRRQGDLDVAHRPVPSAPREISAMTNLSSTSDLSTTIASTRRAPAQIAPGRPIRTVRAQQAPAEPVAAAPVETMVQDAKSAYLDLAREAAQAVAEASVLVPRPGPAGATAPAADENDRWVDDVGREFEPVSKNLTQAFQFLLEAVPAEKAPAT